jgi:hypothetical protein
MAAITRQERDHRRLMLDHQEKTKVEQRGSGLQQPEPQLKMPLIGEVCRPPEVSPPKRSRRQTKKHEQLRLGE